MVLIWCASLLFIEGLNFFNAIAIERARLLTFASASTEAPASGHLAQLVRALP